MLYKSDFRAWLADDVRKHVRDVGERGRHLWVQGLWKVEGVGCRVQGVGCRLRLKLKGAGCRVYGAGCRVQGDRTLNPTWLADDVQKHVCDVGERGRHLPLRHHENQFRGFCSGLRV